MSQYILALDQGTTSSRAIAFDRSGNIAALSQQSLPQHYPQAGWVEHDPLEIWDTQRRAAAEVIARLPEGSVAGIGVTNQRETTILWDKNTGEPVYNAIVWQCRRTAELCEELKRQGLEERIRSATGLLIDAYFSGSKIRWILDNVPGVRRRAERGEVLFGTVESWLIWKLTGRHVTDYANASRTMLFDIHRLAWDEELCGILGVPTAMLPQPVPNSAVYGTVQPSIPGLESLAGVPVCGAAGDQQSALPVVLAPVLLIGGKSVHGVKRGGGVSIDIGGVRAEGAVQVQPQQRRGLFPIPGKLQLAEGHTPCLQLPAQKRRLGGLSGAVRPLEYDQFPPHAMLPPSVRACTFGLFYHAPAHLSMKKLKYPGPGCAVPLFSPGLLQETVVFASPVWYTTILI